MRNTIAKITAATALAGLALFAGAGVADAHECRHHLQGALAVGGDASSTGDDNDALAVGGDAAAEQGLALAVGGDAASEGGSALAVGGDASSTAEQSDDSGDEPC